MDDRRAVIELAAEAQRQAHGEDRGKRRRLLKNAGKRRLHRAEQAVGEKQIAAGVAGQAQLRQRQQVDACRTRARIVSVLVCTSATCTSIVPAAVLINPSVMNLCS